MEKSSAVHMSIFLTYLVFNSNINLPMDFVFLINFLYTVNFIVKQIIVLNHPSHDSLHSYMYPITDDHKLCQLLSFCQNA